MARDVAANRPWGTYTPIDDKTWRNRGWMIFSTSGTTATPRSFRYTALDAELWATTSARALYAMGVRAGDSALTCTNYNPHVFFWSIHHAFNLMKVAVVPGGVPTERRLQMIDLYRPTILVATPSYSLHLAGAMREAGGDPAASSIAKVICGGEPASGIASTRRRIEETWNADYARRLRMHRSGPGGMGVHLSRRTQARSGRRRMCRRICRFGSWSIPTRSSRWRRARAD